MALLPQLGYEYNEREVTDVFAGYRHRLRIADGEWYDMKNLTSADYPLLANRKRRGLVRRVTAPGGLLAREKLAVIENGVLYYGGRRTMVEGLSAGEKQLVSMGTYLCIFPDKVYFNTAKWTDFGTMGASYRSGGRVRYRMCRADGTEYENVTASARAPENPENARLWLDSAGDSPALREWSSASESWVEIPTVYTKIVFASNGILPRRFRRYDGVTITGAGVEHCNGEKILYEVGGDEANLDFVVVVGLLEEAVTQSEGTVRIERRVPDLDFVCEAKNRLWGCRSGEADGESVNEICCCALGDFKNWRQFRGLSTDSWSASVGSDGPWTGAVNYLGAPLFFKENRLYRVGISAAGAHSLSETVCRGVQRGSHKSLQVVHELLFYKSTGEVCVYQGSFPEGISDALGEESYADAVAGSVGDRYYISMRDTAVPPVSDEVTPDSLVVEPAPVYGPDAWRLFVYDVRRQLWMREDTLHALDFARLGDELYCLTENELIAMLGTDGSREPPVEWEAESGMLYYQLPDRKYISRFNLRLWMEEGAELSVYLMYDSSGEWVRQGRIRMKGTGTVTLPIRPRRCDHLRMKLAGRGDVKLYSVARILSVGSDVG